MNQKKSYVLKSFPQSKIPELKKFLRTVVLNLRKKTRLNDERKAENRFYLAKEGEAIVLIDQEIDKYQDLIKILSEIYPVSKKYSKHYSEQTLNEAIWATLKSEDSVSDSWKDGLKIVNKNYSIRAKDLNVYFPVSGLSFKGTEWIFGPVTFVKINNQDFKKKLKKSFLTKEWSFSGSEIDCYLKIRVTAADMSSAVNVAKPKADLYIAVLNALSDIAGSSNPGNIFSSYMKVGESLHSTLIVTQKDQVVGISRSLTLSLSGFNPHALRAYPFIRNFRIIKIGKELRNYTNSLYTTRIFPALKWMGKAVSQKSREEIFLYYCLAYEAIIFDSKSGEKTMETLQKRLYRLLFTSGNYLGDSLTSYNKFEYLYKLRSDIVHRGGTEVTDSDIFLARNLVLGCLYKLLIKGSNFARFKTSSEFEKWLSKI